MTQYRLKRRDELPAWRGADRATRMQILRALSGLTQIELAHIAGVSPGTVKLAEADPCCQRLDTIERILSALGRSLADLLSGDEPEPNNPPVDS